MEGDQKAIFKEQLLNILDAEGTRIVRVRICDLVAELGGSIFECEQEHWKELLLKIAGLLQSEAEGDLEVAFRICESYIPYAFDEFKAHHAVLSKVIERALVSSNFHLAESAVDCFAAICALIEKEELKAF